MMSFKTLYGFETKWSKVFPPKEEIAGIFRCDDLYNCLHYADYDNDPLFWRSLSQAIGYGGIGISAVQLDMIWPEPGNIANAVHVSRKQIEVILQVGAKAMEAAGNDPVEVVRRLEDYDGVIHRVLLDKSMGRGLGMDAEGLLQFARAIRKRFPELGITVAGGLGPDTLHFLGSLPIQFPDISIDAQGKLRPSGNALDPVDWDMAGRYLIKALELLK